MNIFHCVQGSSAWHQVRAGKVTASEVGKVLRYVKKGSKKRGDVRIEESADRANLRASIVAELLSGMPDMEGYLSPYMQRGNDLEDDARRAYELAQGVMVERMGFILHPTIERYGASPDGVLERGGLEIKVPGKATHLKTLLGGVIPLEHEPQMYANMDCSEADWWDFCSFCPEFPDPLKTFIRRLPRNDAKIQTLRDGVNQFNGEVDEVISLLRKHIGAFELPAQMQPPLREQLAESLGLLTDEDFVGLV